MAEYIITEHPDYPYEEPKPQELVRCKDCVRFDKRRGCNLVEGLNIAKADSFCSYAERKSDGVDR